LRKIGYKIVKKILDYLEYMSLVKKDRLPGQILSLMSLMPYCLRKYLKAYTLELKSLLFYNLFMEIFMEVLTVDQQEILPKLGFLKEQNFYLAGGTALALQIKHRTSVDFDFYTEKDFHPAGIYEQFQKQKNRKILLSAITEKNTLLLEINDVSISLFTYPYPLVQNIVKSHYFSLASLEDIAAMKMIAIIQRGTKRDFIDLYFLIRKIGLRKIFSFAREKYPGFNEYLALQSLTYFKDAEIENNNRNIKLLEPFNWKDAKKFFITEVEKIKETWRRKR